MPETIEVVLFDMGGVLVQLGDLGRELGADGLSTAEFWDRWLTSPAVRALEMGTSNIDRFAAELTDEFDLDLSPEQIIERFTAVPRGLFPGAVEMVRSVPESLVTGVLSNTNEVHWETQPDAEIVKSLFDREYVSFKLGLMKPDRPIFDHVIADLGVAPDKVLFIDDNQMNVDGARAAGLRSEMAKGPGAGAVVLKEYGLVSSD